MRAPAGHVDDRDRIVDRTGAAGDVPPRGLARQIYVGDESDIAGSLGFQLAHRFITRSCNGDSKPFISQCFLQHKGEYFFVFDNKPQDG